MILPFRDLPKAESPYIILRHDVDVSLVQALKMAEREHEIGIRSTYFVMLSSKHYNIWEGENALRVMQISKLGHDIGLHYDFSQYECYADNAESALKSELNALEKLLGQNVKSISSHAPMKPESHIRIDGYFDADDRELFDVYVHDSQKLWTVKSLSALLDRCPMRAQLLTHPCHWATKLNSRGRMLDQSLMHLLLLLYKLRTIAIRVLHSRESCEN
jgi:hypothetical protein